MTTETQPMLPGFEPPKPGENKIVVAATSQLQKLATEELLTSDHAITAQLVLSLAQSVGGSLAGGRLTIAGVQGAKLLLEAVAELPKAEGGAMNALIEKLLETENAKA